MSLSPLGRVVDIAEDGRHLSRNRGFVVVSAGREEIGRVPLDDVAAVLATSPATTASCALLAELAERGIPFVLCGRNHAPAGLLWPVAGHHAQQRRMEAQLDRSHTLGPALWAQIVRAKLLRQGWALASIGKPGRVFGRLADLVEPGDPGNLEARGARRYWPLMMGASFRRDTDGTGLNALLNYGYAVLRAATARAIAAAGLHPGIGVFHRHPHNAMPLADDLMEPFRSLIDLAVLELGQGGMVAEVTPESKRVLVAVLAGEEPTALGHTPVSTSMMRLSASLADSFVSGIPRLEFPVLSGGEEFDRTHR